VIKHTLIKASYS